MIIKHKKMRESKFVKGARGNKNKTKNGLGGLGGLARVVNTKLWGVGGCCQLLCVMCH